MESLDENEDNKIALHVEDTEINCDRKKLIENSPYFEVMFNGNFSEKYKKQITLQGVKINGLKNILNLIDKKINFIPFDSIYDALEVACMLQFDFVKQHCIKKLQENINIDTCLRTWQIADKLDIHPLAEKAQCKALMDFNEVKNTNNLYLLNIQELHSYLSNTLIHCDNEIDVFETGLKWWYEFCKRNKELDNCKEDDKIKYETKYLSVILRCLDYNVITKSDINNIFLICPDINNNAFIKNILLSITKLICGEPVSDETLEDRTAVEFFHNCRRRRKSYLPSVVCHKINENFNKRKKQKYLNCNCFTTINIYYYEKKTEQMTNLVDLCMHNEERCNALLEGYQIIPYKEMLLFYGGEYKYGTADWNKSVWAYSTFTEDWKLLTKLPKERRHFKSIVIQDKLYIIGGTGKYRIIQDNMMVYDLQNDKWDSLIMLPQSLYSIKCCNFKNVLFVMSGNLANTFGFLYYSDSKYWQRVDIKDPMQKLPKDMGDFIIFSLNDFLYIKGMHLIQMELIGTELIVKKSSQQSKVLALPDVLGYCQDEELLYMFSHHTYESGLSNIYVLELCNLESDTNRTLLQVNDCVDISWNINSGCFAFFHHSIVRDSKTVLDFIF